MNVYCTSCGFKNAYTGVKPKVCQSCNEPFDAIKVTHKTEAKIKRRPRDEEELEIEAAAELDYDPEAVKGSIGLVSEGNEQILTVESLRKSMGSFERGGSPVSDKVKNEVMNGMLKGGPAVTPEFNPPAEARSSARRVGKLSRPSR